MDKMVITCAVTGAETTRANNPNLPITPQEIADAAAEARKAGASILHLHVRDAKGNPTQDPAVFKEAVSLIRKKTDMVIEFTTGGAVGMTSQERLAPIALEPEMASLDCGTINFGDDYIINTLPMMREFAAEFAKHKVFPTLECFDLAHIYASHVLIKEGLVKPPYYYGFGMNIHGGIKFELDVLALFVNKLPPGSFWTPVGISRASLPAVYSAISMGGRGRCSSRHFWMSSDGLLLSSAAIFLAAGTRSSEIQVGPQPSTCSFKCSSIRSSSAALPPG